MLKVLKEKGENKIEEKHHELIIRIEGSFAEI